MGYLSIPMAAMAARRGGFDAHESLLVMKMYKIVRQNLPLQVDGDAGPTKELLCY
jgi:hypothetical protein